MEPSSESPPTPPLASPSVPPSAPPSAPALPPSAPPAPPSASPSSASPPAPPPPAPQLDLPSFPPLPPIKSFSSCLLILESLRSTTEKIQRSLFAHYGDLCRGCEAKSGSAEDSKKPDVKDSETIVIDETSECRDESVSAGSSRNVETKDGNSDAATSKSDDDVVLIKGSFDDDEGLTVEDDFLPPPPPPPSTKSVKKESPSYDKILHPSRKSTKKEKSRKISSSSSSSSSLNESLKRKREEEIDRIKKKLKRMEANQTEGNAKAKETTERKASVPKSSETDNIPLPPVPDCILGLKMSEPKLRNYEQIAKVLHNELGDVDYKEVVDRFIDEFDKEREKQEACGRAKNSGKHEEIIAVCKFSLSCWMGKTCVRRHPNTLAQPDKILLLRLEDEAGRKLIPRWLRVKEKYIRGLGQSLREKKEKMGEVDFERGMRIAEAYYKFEASRKVAKLCNGGSKCETMFCSGIHPNRTSMVSAKDYVLWVLDKHMAGYYTEELFPPFETIFPSYIAAERHINYVCCLLRYRRDMGKQAFDQVLRTMEREIPREKKKANRAKCANSFAQCKYRSSCKFMHNDMYNDLKILCDALKEAKK